jgi:hypothetical protein
METLLFSAGHKLNYARPYLSGFPKTSILGKASFAKKYTSSRQGQYAI